MAPWSRKQPFLSVIIPALNEEAHIEQAVASARRCQHCEVIVADGGSHDATVQRARRLGVRVLTAPRGRGSQMNAGAAVARGEVLLFLHADNTLPEGYEEAVCSSLGRACTPPPQQRQRQRQRQQQQHRKQPPAEQQQQRQPPPAARWGCFESISIDGPPLAAWVLRHAVALRTRLVHRPYGDQGLFVGRSTFQALGGFPQQPLLEDLELVRRLRLRCGPPAVLPHALQTSGRRWHKLGLFKTTLINQVILLGHSLGVDVGVLAALYQRA